MFGLVSFGYFSRRNDVLIRSRFFRLLSLFYWEDLLYYWRPYEDPIEWFVFDSAFLWSEEWQNEWGFEAFGLSSKIIAVDSYV